MKYTVVGVYGDNGWHDDWSRAAFHVEAESPEQAEQIANDDQHGDGELIVAGVFEGELMAVDR